MLLFWKFEKESLTQNYQDLLHHDILFIYYDDVMLKRQT